MPNELVPVQPSMLETLPVEQVLHELRTRWERSLSPQTREAYVHDLRDFEEWNERTGSGFLLTVSANEINLYRVALEDLGRAKSTIARRLAGIASFYRRASRETGGRYRSPFADGLVDRPKVPQRSQVLGPDLAQCRRLVDAARVSGPRDYALIRLLVDNGLRISEALSVRLEQITEDRGVPVIVNLVRKGEKLQTVRIAPETWEALAAIIGDRSEGFLFVTRTGKPLDRHAAGRTVGALCRRAGLEGVSLHPHSLRHSHATLALGAGVSINRVARDLGHDNLQTTIGYDDAMKAISDPTSVVVAALIG